MASNNGREKRLETINAFLIRTYNPTYVKDYESGAQKDLFRVQESQVLFAKRTPNWSHQKAQIEQDLIWIDLEPRARYYYVHVMAKKIQSEIR